VIKQRVGRAEVRLDIAIGHRPWEVGAGT